MYAGASVGVFAFFLASPANELNDCPHSWNARTEEGLVSARQDGVQQGKGQRPDSSNGWCHLLQGSQRANHRATASCAHQIHHRRKLVLLAEAVRVWAWMWP